MFETNRPIGSVVPQPILPTGKLQGDGHSSAKSASIRGRILHVRNGRQRPRRYSPMPFGGTNRRGPRTQRRASRVIDKSGDRVVTLLVPAGAIFDNSTGKEILLKVSS